MLTTLPLSRKVLEMEESSTLLMAKLARNLAAQGHKVISLSLGEPDFDTPEHIKTAAKEALDQGYTKYTPVSGLPVLREAICTKFKRDNGLEFKPNNIVVSNGAKQSIANICLSLLDEGDEAVILAPYWVSYFEIVKFAGGVPVVVHAGIDQDYKPSVAQIEAAITDRTKLLIFSSPCNPTGSVFTYAELEAMAQMLGKYEQVHIVSDEIYEYINFTGKHASIGTFEPVRDRTITVNGFAKGFAMTGWRLGYIGGPEWLAQACDKIQGQFTSGATSFGQKAAAHALLSDLSPTWAMRDAFLRRRDLVIGLLGQVPGMKVNLPQGAFYVFPDISNYFGLSDGQTVVNNADDFSMYLLNSAHVATVSGVGFGDSNCLRLSYAASEEELKEAIERIGEAVGRLK